LLGPKCENHSNNLVLLGSQSENCDHAFSKTIGFAPAICEKTVQRNVSSVKTPGFYALVKYTHPNLKLLTPTEIAS
jgi:hypothetical protein